MMFESEKKSTAGRSGRSRTLLPIVFFLILTGATLLLHLEKFQRQKEVLGVKGQASAMARAHPVAGVKAQRSRFYKIRYYLDYPAATSDAVTDFVRRLSATIPLPQVRELQIDLSLQNLSFRLTVGIAAGGPGNAQRAAAGYLEQIRKFPEILWAALAKSDPVKGNGAENRDRFFFITGQAEM